MFTHDIMEGHVSLWSEMVDADEILHAGVAHDEHPPGRGSGRYPWGSGDNPEQHQLTFLSEVKKMRAKGIKDPEIAKALLGPKAYTKDGEPVWSTTTELRAAIAVARTETRKVARSRAIKVLDECDGNISEAARKLGMKNESSLRSLLNEVSAERTEKYTNTAEMIKKVVDEKGFVDVGKGTEYSLGVTASTKNVALSILEQQGYVMTKVQVPQAGDREKKTTILVIAPPGTPKSEIQKNKFNIKGIEDFTPDKGKTWWVPEFPESLDSKRIMIRYAEDGGTEKDGVIEIRPGVEDLSLGGARYSQVRIAVDGSHYMKGMAIYADDKDFPKGYDIIYNTNKKKGTPMMSDDGGSEVLKRMKIDKATGEVDRENPFGALIKSPKEKDGVISAGGQRHYIGKDGKEHLSPINKLQDEGDWDSWSRNLSSQFLSKQPLKLINQQIKLSIADKEAEFDSIMQLTNPVIKKKMLEDFANSCDANASDLSVKGFKNQAFQVILPITDMKENEIYAPNFKDGDTVALVRYPHGGVFEIPVLKVNNKHKTAEKVITKTAVDAVGINSKVAEQLSGADFDGDTALVIPMSSNRLNIKHSKPLDGLKGFDPKALYKLPDDAPQMKNKTKQKEMGIVTNLITDMTVGGAGESEICRAVRHSMVVIDAEKHHLDYKQSYQDHNIRQLKETYQGINEKTGDVKGASTILSQAKSKIYINHRNEVTDTKKMTPEELKRWNEGKKVYRDSGKRTLQQIKDPKKMTPEELELYNSGKKVYREGKLKQIKVTRMDATDDAMTLVREKDNAKEMAYAEYANTLKGLANQARKEYRSMKPIPVSTSAKKTYAKEVETLNEKLTNALRNDPRERQAQTIANAISSAKFESNPDMDYEHRQREQARALNEARAMVGAKKDRIVITDKEWEAIQANAISTNKLTQILNNTDQEAFKKRATPKEGRKLTQAQINLIKAMASSGMYTQKDIAEGLGISTSAVSSAIKSA